MTNRYATVSITDGIKEGTDGETTHRSHTERLGCSVTHVDGYHFPAGGTIGLSPTPEQVCIPLDSNGLMRLAGSRVPFPGIGCVHAGTKATLQCEEPTAIVVVSVSAEPCPTSDPQTVDIEECEFTMPSPSSIKTARLTAMLGCTGMKLNARILDPGERVPYHTEGAQEELFVPIRGPAAMRVDAETFENSVGTVTRVAPPVPRSASNPGDNESLWIMIGAPPTGEPTEWGPGAEMLE